jgi:hypothetical protein
MYNMDSTAVLFSPFGIALEPMYYVIAMDNSGYRLYTCDGYDIFPEAQDGFDARAGLTDLE